MKAMMHLAAAADAGAAVHAIANESWHSPQAPTPTNTMTRRSTRRTIKELAKTPMRPMHVTMIEYEKASVTPAMVRKYVV